MIYRDITTQAGDLFKVPEHILRVDRDDFHGWQLRYGEWTEFADGPGGAAGAEKALALAISQMQFRIDTLGK